MLNYRLSSTKGDNMGIFKIFKKKSKEILEKPEYFNFISAFNHTNIIQTKELLGCNSTQSLFLECEKDERKDIEKKVGFVFIGDIGKKVYSSFENREIELKHYLIISKLTDMEESASKKKEREQFIIPTDYKHLSFASGSAWVEANQLQLEKYVENFKDPQLVYVITESTGFSLMLAKNISTLLKQRGKVPFLILPIQHFEIFKRETFDFLVFYHHLLSLEPNETFPFMIVDENELLRYSPSEDIEKIRSYYYKRIGYALLDLSILLFNLNSLVYRIDSSTILDIFTKLKGPYRLLYFDIYDNNSAISTVFDSLAEIDTKTYISNAVAGYIAIQPSMKGLVTEEYQKIRKMYSNKDIFISVVHPRTKGAIIRGIFATEGLSKETLEEFSTLLNSNYIQTWKEDGEEDSTIYISATNDLESMLSIEYYTIEPIVEEKED